jgi:hypothetical protein
MKLAKVVTPVIILLCLFPPLLCRIGMLLQMALFMRMHGGGRFDWGSGQWRMYLRCRVNTVIMLSQLYLFL